MILNSEVEKINEELSKEFDRSVIRQVSKGGAKLDYVPVAEVIARLNLVLGTQHWSIDAAEVWIDGNNTDWALSKVTVSAIIGGVSTRKIGFGGQKIKQLKAGGPVDLGDELKGAMSDAFKKACQQFGVGLELARTDEALEAEDEERYRIESDSLPKADEETLKGLKETIANLTEEQAKESKTWWIKQGFPGLDKGLTTDQAEFIKNYLTQLIEKEKPFDAN